MKRAITTIIALAALVSGCATVETTHATDNTSMFVKLEQADSWEVVYHRDTKVMYVVSDGSYNHGTFTMLVNHDGTPMLWEE